MERVVVVSNRLPAAAALDTTDERRQDVGGLVSALAAALAERGGLWFGWSGKVANPAGGPPVRVSKVGRTSLAAVDLPEEDVNLFYTTFSNRTLWPLLHCFADRVTMRADAFRAYQRVNAAFADALYPLLRAGDLVWVHDYHLFPLGAELRRRGWRGKLGFFLHTPFPPVDVFAILPWARQLLTDCTDYDLFGVHTVRYAHHFVEALQSELGGRAGRRPQDREARCPAVEAFPVGIDPELFRSLGSRSDLSPSGKLRRLTRTRKQIILGVDRLDYTKGIPWRLMAFESLLDRYPSLRGKVTLIQIAVPSRTRVRENVEEKEQVERLVGQINGRFAEPGWTPVQYLYRTYSQADLVRFYRMAHVCLVTPLRDGMNLVAKEYVASQGPNPGVLVLSRFCGAAEAMREAVIVNPYDVRATSDAIHLALGMPARERRRRWEALRDQVQAPTAKEWADRFLAALENTAARASSGPGRERADRRSNLPWLPGWKGQEESAFAGSRGWPAPRPLELAGHE